ncbi:MAG: flavodoxin family protein [Peptostreptococcus sp.]|uniref:flavodoxin family protein n=1 Tax=Peptostreptococcus sp. TaxID=1262 RepID=UPI002FC6DD89
MGKKILVLSASPRRHGNSDSLSDEFIRGAKDSGNDVEKIFLRDKRIEYCNGCGACLKTHKCVIKDDMEEILGKMSNADVIVMATPVYFYSVSAQMKTLIDRTYPVFKNLKNKEFYFILSAEDTSKERMSRAIETFRGFSEYCLPNSHEMGIIYGAGVLDAGAIKDTPAMKEAYDMALAIK